MPTIRVTSETLQLIREQSTPGFRYTSTARRRPDGDWDLPVDDEIAYAIAMVRLPGESDDDVVSRLVRAAIGQSWTAAVAGNCSKCSILLTGWAIRRP